LSQQQQHHVQNQTFGRRVATFDGWDMNSLNRYDVKEMLGKGD
jgi:hypothetical protein